MAEVRIGAELGMYKVVREPFRRFQQPIENTAGLRPETYVNKNYQNSDVESKSLKPGSTKPRYEFKGTTVNLLA